MVAVSLVPHYSLFPCRWRRLCCFRCLELSRVHRLHPHQPVHRSPCLRLGLLMCSPYLMVTPVILAWLLVGGWNFACTSRLLLSLVVRLRHCLDFLARATGSSFGPVCVMVSIALACAQSPCPRCSPTPGLSSTAPLTLPLPLTLSLPLCVLCRMSATPFVCLWYGPRPWSVVSRACARVRCADELTAWPVPWLPAPPSVSDCCLVPSDATFPLALSRCPLRFQCDALAETTNTLIHTTYLCAYRRG